MLSYLLPVVVGGLFIAYFVGKPYWREYKRNQARRLPFTKQWRKIIQQRMPYFKKMPTHLQLQLKEHIQVFLSEKIRRLQWHCYFRRNKSDYCRPSLFAAAQS